MFSLARMERHYFTQDIEHSTQKGIASADEIKIQTNNFWSAQQILKACLVRIIVFPSNFNVSQKKKLKNVQSKIKISSNYKVKFTLSGIQLKISRHNKRKLGLIRPENNQEKRFRNDTDTRISRQGFENNYYNSPYVEKDGGNHKHNKQKKKNNNAI